MGKKSDKEAALDKKQAMEKRMMLEAFIKENIFHPHKTAFAEWLGEKKSNFSPDFGKEAAKIDKFVQLHGHFPTREENEQLYLRARHRWVEYLNNKDENREKAKRLTSLGYVHNPADEITGEEYLNCLDYVSDKFILRLWDKLKKQLELDDKQLISLYQTMVLADELDKISLNRNFTTTNISDIEKWKYRMELLRTYITSDYDEQERVKKHYGFCSEELERLDCESDERLVALHAWYSFKYYSSQTKHSLLDGYCNEMTACFPESELKIQAIKNNIREFSCSCFYIYYVTELTYIKDLQKKISAITNIEDAVKRSLFQYRVYQNEDLLKNIEIKFEKEIIEKMHLPLYMKSDDTPGRLYQLYNKGGIIFLVVFERTSDQSLIVNHYILVQYYEYLILLGIIFSGGENMSFYNLNATSDGTLTLLPPKQSNGIEIELEILKNNITDKDLLQTIELKKKVENRLKGMTVLFTQIHTTIQIYVYFLDENKTCIFEKEVKDDKRLNAITPLNMNNVEIYFTNEFVFSWSGTGILIPFSEFTVRPYEKPNEKDCEI